MLAGVASLLFYTIGYSYLDETVAKDKVPLLLCKTIFYSHFLRRMANKE